MRSRRAWLMPAMLLAATGCTDPDGERADPAPASPAPVVEVCGDLAELLRVQADMHCYTFGVDLSARR